MKCLIIFGLLFAFCQAESDPYAFVHELRAGITDCIKEQNLDDAKTREILERYELPQDDPKFLEFFNCYHIKTHLFNADGTGNEEKLKSELPSLIWLVFGEDIPATHFAREAGPHCKDTPPGETAAITTIRLRGCVLNYVAQNRHKFDSV